MRLRMSAASLSSMTVATAGGAPLGEAAVVWRYCPNPARKTTKGKTQKAQAEPARGPLALRCCRIALGMPLEPASRLVSFLCQAHEFRDDSSIVVVCWIEEEP